MATITTAHWGNNYSPQAELTVNVSSQDGGSVTYSYTLRYLTSGYSAYTNGQARAYTISIDGQRITGSININGIGTTTVRTGTVRVSKSNSPRNIGYSITFDMSVSWAGAWRTTVSANGSLGVPARESHTVSYNANGGSGAPSSQTKWWGSILTLSGTIPSRYGYTFQGWSKNNPSGSVNYRPNNQYGYDENATMYAVWSPVAYTVSFDANGGGGAPSSQTKYHDQNLTLSGTRPTRANYNFLGWATSSGASTASYQPSSTYSTNGDITLYAVWSLAYLVPRINTVVADRCNSGGVLQESGQYAKVGFKWATDRTVSEIKIEWKTSTSTTWSSTTVSASGSNGTVSQVIGNNGLNTDYTYNIRITVRDSVGSNTYNIDVPAMLYTIDFKAGGKGIAIGKPATSDNLFDVKFNTRIDGSLSTGGEVSSSSNIKASGTLYQKGKTLLDTFYPVGSIFITTVNTNPSSYMGGTWARFGNGQTLVGVNESDGDFSTVQKTGGDKSHTIDYSNLPARATIQKSWKGGMVSYAPWQGGSVGSGTWIVSTPYDMGEPYGKTISNLQPYITVYMWKRTG